ncbi:transposase [Streptomyces hirsutus]|uniref:transposase n=1 Tax=Streptomyces hirsutus TaxID=35620 RepID=UPI003674B8FA
MSKKSNTSKRYTTEFKRDAVAPAPSSDKTVTEIARDLGVSPEGLRGWVKQAKVDRGEGPAGGSDQPLTKPPARPALGRAPKCPAGMSSRALAGRSAHAGSPVASPARTNRAAAASCRGNGRRGLSLSTLT